MELFLPEQQINYIYSLVTMNYYQHIPIVKAFLQWPQFFNLESSVECEKDVQDIDVRREFKKSVATLLVMSICSNFLGALRACSDVRDSTDESKFMRIGLILWLLASVSPLSSVQAQELTEAVSPIEFNTQHTLDTLNAMVRTEQYLLQRIEEVSESLASTPSQSGKAELQQQEQQLRNELNATRKSFDEIATESSISQLKGQEQPKFDLAQEVLLLLEPALKEIKRMTNDVRHKSELKEKLSIYNERIEIVNAALERIEELSDVAKKESLIEALDGRKAKWVLQQTLLENDTNSVRLQLEKMQAAEVSFTQASQTYFKEFVQNRGLYLTIAVAVVLGIIGLSKFSLGIMQRVLPGFKAKHKSFRIRLLQLMHQMISLIFIIIGPMVVFYFAEDWMLFSLGILVLLAAAWTLRSTIPRYWQQIQLFLNIGSVREGERIEIDGLPWLVTQISFYTLLENPSAGINQRVPIESLVGKTSRPFSHNEPWFPCRMQDWVILSDGVRAKVIGISQELVQLIERGGALRTYLMMDFLALAPRNISTNFRLRETIGITYDLQRTATSEVSEILKAYVQKQVIEEGLEDQVHNIRVELTAAGASSLDLVVIIDFKGDLGELYGRLRRSMLRWCVDACSENDWEIPFQQLTLHGASS